MRSLSWLLALAAAAPLAAETGHDAWLRYAELQGGALRIYDTLPATVTAFGDSVVIQAAQRELIRGVRGMLGRTLRSEGRLPQESAIILGTLQAVSHITAPLPDLKLEDSYWLKTVTVGGRFCLLIAAPNDRGVLYGVFALLRKIALGEPVSRLDERQAPYAAVRWVNHWDNLDGSIERGYGGRSLFFENNQVRAELGPARDYARLLA